MTKTNIIPEETLIYKELKSKFETNDPELWKEVSENLKQVIKSNNNSSEDGFEDFVSMQYCFDWSESAQGHKYWNGIACKLNGGKNWWQ